MGARVMLYVEDEDAAVFLLEIALKETKIDLELYRVSNGEDAIAFLKQTGAYRNAPRSLHGIDFTPALTWCCLI